MPDIYELINQFRTELLRNERQAAAAMVREYGKVWKQIDGRIKTLVAQYKAAESPQASWLYEQERLESLRTQVEQEIARFSKIAGETILEQNSQAVKLAAQHTERMIGTYAGFNKLPREALANMIGALQPGTALSDYLAGLGSGMGQMVSDKLLEGLAIGLGAMEISRMIREAFGANLTSALRTARTEPLRAYREASRQVYQANSHIVGGWIWRSARNERTCGMCWAMDGTEHGLDEQLDDHICGRCFMTPMLPGMKRKETGIQAFEKLSASEQLKILGPAKYAAWKDGKFSLPDLVGRKYDPHWGWMRYEKSLREMGIDWQVYIARGNLKIQNILAGEFTQEQLVAIGKQLTAELQAITGLEQRWSGTIALLSRRQAPDYWGAKVPTCEILLRVDAQLNTLVHELLHGMSVGLNVPMYRKYIGFEEGVVESLQRIFGPGSLAKIGQTPVVGLVSYNDYIHQLERLRRWSGLSLETFYLRMIRTPLGERVQLSVKMLVEAGYTERAAKGLVTKILNIMMAF